MKNKSTGWIVFCEEEKTRIAEVRADEFIALMSYEDAKQVAIQTLKDHIAPYLAQIEELERDVYAEAGALPPLKAWRQSRDPRAVIIAKTKKRAMELARKTRHSFDADWQECDGDWWYYLGHEEAIWIEIQNEQSQGTGTFYKPVSVEEAN